MSGWELIDEIAWVAWVEHVAAALEVNASGVSPRAVHDLTGQVAARYQRPMAPVSAYLWGLAIATHPDLCRSEERRVGKECRSRWSPYH